MTVDNPWLLASGLLIGLVGLMVLNHGRREVNLRMLSAGLFLCVYPYFVSSLLLLWGVFAATLAVLALVGRNLSDL